MRLELTTYSMASCRSSQLSYARIRRYRCGDEVCKDRKPVNPPASGVGGPIEQAGSVDGAVGEDDIGPGTTQR